MDRTRKLIVGLAVGLLHSSISAQTVGGDFRVTRQWAEGFGNVVFGQAMDGAGDLNGDGYDDVVVGDYYYSTSSLHYAGAVYAYSGMDGSLLYRWTGEDAEYRLGSSVAAAGDINGDGFDDVLASAPLATTTFGRGVVYVYSGFDGSIMFRIYGDAIWGNFGISVSSAGDMNADGTPDVLVGAYYKDVGSLAHAGSAYVYSGANGSLLYQFDGLIPGNSLGWSVSDAGDVNADGHDDVIIGAPNTVFAYWGTGDAYVYSGADGSMLHHFSGVNLMDDFGWSVSGAGDADGDGFDDLIVGAVEEDGPGGMVEAGTAYLYSGATGALIHKWSGNISGARLGYSVSDIGDANWDGFDDVVVGSPSGSGRQGRVDVFSGKDGTSILFSRGPTANNNSFGRVVSNGGDVNGDGFTDLAASMQDEHSFTPDTVFISNLLPFLGADSTTISAATGGSVNLTIAIPDAPNYLYKVLVSQLGAGPTNYGVDVPISLDSLVFQSFLGNYPTTSSGMHGSLDNNGKASATISAPAGLPSALIGRSYYLAAIANQPNQLPEFSSISVVLTIVP